MLRLQQLGLNEVLSEDQKDVECTVKLSPNRQWAIVRLCQEDSEKTFDKIYLYRCDEKQSVDFIPQLEASHYIGSDCQLNWVKKQLVTLCCIRPLL